VTPPCFHLRPGPEILSLLVNGLETPEDLFTLARRFPLRADMWQTMLNAKKPVAFNLLFTVGRVRATATITIINACADAFFGLLGTNEVPHQPGGRT
jgi:hypothetical protein